MKTIVITGGHHNSALVVAQELIKRGHKVVWIGHRHSSRGDTQESAEYIEVTAAGIPFHDLNAAKLMPSLTELIRFPSGILTALKLLRQIQPTAILSFGGYLGGTVALAGKCLGIPLYLHEQTVTAGAANRLIGQLAKRVYLTWPASQVHFTPAQSQVVGLPLRPSILSAKPKHLFARRKPTLLVMGGKQGAHVINQFIFTHLQDLLAHFNIVHQTGTSSLTHDYEHALSLQNGLASLADSYLPLGYITESEIGSYLQSADLYLGRSGAHICYELGLLGLRSVLVPLATSRAAEQHHNADMLVQAQLALILPQSELGLSSFLAQITLLKQLPLKTLALPRNATAVLVDDLIARLK